MDKSLRDKNGIIRIKRMRIFLAILLLSPLLFISTDLDVLGEEITKFHIIAEDLNLINFESLLKEYSPQIKYGGNISLEADLKFEEGAVTIANGNFSSAEVSLSGDNSSLPLDLSNLEGNFEVKLAEGKPTIKGKIRSAEGQWGRLSFQNLETDYNLYEKKLDISKCEVKLAEGTVYINGDIDFTKSPPLFDIKLTAEGINISSISGRWGYTKPLSGILFSDVNLSGKWGDPTTYSGRGKVKIEEGDLGEIGLIGRIITFSPLAAISGDFPLTTLEGDFNISEGYASTENTIIKGPDVKITAKGDVGWNKKLDFTLGLYTSSELLKGTPLTKTLGVIVDNFGNVLRRVKLTGTIDNPAFTIVPLGIGGAIIEGLQKSFEKGSQGENTP